MRGHNLCSRVCDTGTGLGVWYHASTPSHTPVCNRPVWRGLRVQPAPSGCACAHLRLVLLSGNVCGPAGVARVSRIGLGSLLQQSPALVREVHRAFTWTPAQAPAQPHHCAPPPAATGSREVPLGAAGWGWTCPAAGQACRACSPEDQGSISAQLPSVSRSFPWCNIG